MVKENKRIIIGGQARLPKDLSSGEVFQVVAEVDRESGKILEIEFSPAFPLLSKKLREWILGVSLAEDLGPVLQMIETGLYHKAKKAVLTAVKDLAREFRESKSREKIPEDLPDSPE